MGQKVNPVGIRLGIVKDWASRWYASSKEFSDTLCADLKVRDFLSDKLSQAGISRIQIDRPARNARVTIYTARPGVIIGKSGKEVEALRDQVSKIVNVPVHISIEEVRKAEIDEAGGRISCSAIRKTHHVPTRHETAVTTALRSGALGIKISVSGRLGGSKLRTEWQRRPRAVANISR